MTRVYAVLQVEIPILPETDLEKAIAVTNRVGQEMAADPEWKDRLLEAPVRSIPSVTDLGVTLRRAERSRARIASRARPSFAGACWWPTPRRAFRSPSGCGRRPGPADRMPIAC